jgi:asparagine synthase (glutamine-hydrolysing)
MPRRVSPEAVFHYLSFLAAPAPLTFFEGISKLAPGTWMRVGFDGTMQERRYWDAWDAVRPLTDVSDADIAAQLLDELRTAVRYRQVSDVPVGVFLSGGIDSSTNTALFSDRKGPVQTFSIGYDADYASYRSELPYAERMAAFVGAAHHVRRLTVDDLLDFVPRMVYHQDEPIGDVVCVPLYYVSKLARDHGVIVCQVGEGADELFCGYPMWKAHLRLAGLDALPVPRLAKCGLMAALRAGGREERYVYECLRRSTAGEPLFWGGAEGLTHVEKQRVMGAALRSRFGGVSSADALLPIRKRFESSAWEQTPLHWMTYLDLNLRLPELLLMRVDKMTMATSLEGRVPFLDHRFVEFALSIPTKVKLRNGELKYILKQAVRGVIPDDLIDRRKQGFGVPLQDWLFDRLGDSVRRTLDRFCRETDLLDGDEVRRYIDRGKGSKVWQLYNLALWHQQFIAGDPSDAPPPLSPSARPGRA